MGLLDRPVLARLNETLEDRLGVGFRPAGELARFQVMEQEFVALRGEAEELALQTMDYWGGRPSEMQAEHRRRIAQKSRIALKFDPLAGAEAQLLADMAFGKGVPVPTARDEEVQKVITEAWSDANNEEKLTGFMAQRKLSNELITAGEVFTTLYVGGGRVRVGRLDTDLVEAIVPDPEDRLRALWYMTRERKFKWDFKNDHADVQDVVAGDGARRVTYWKHWRNYDDAIFERENGMIEPGEDEDITPPQDKQAKGVVFHLAINQTGEELRGNPPWARALRFQHAMNVLTESHVAMAQAASTFVAKRKMIGTPRTVAKAAAGVLGHLSELGATRRDTEETSIAGGRGETTPLAPGGAQPPSPGAWWSENQASTLEALSLQSGSAQMAQTAQIVRAPIAAASGFGQHYLGDASNANLATASTLELPANMRVESWQESLAQLYRWFTDRAIEAAVKSGRLGGLDGFPEDGPMSQMRLHEAEDRERMERRTKRDLSYEFVMPFPGRRALPEVGTYVTAMCQSMDPNGVNIRLRRHFLRFAFEAMGVQDVGRAVLESLPEEGVPGGVGPREDPPEVDPETGLPVPRAEEEPRNVKRQSTPPGERPQSQEQEWLPLELRRAAREFEEELAGSFRKMVGEPALLSTLGLVEPDPALATANGAG